MAGPYSPKPKEQHHPNISGNRIHKKKKREDHNIYLQRAVQPAHLVVYRHLGRLDRLVQMRRGGAVPQVGGQGRREAPLGRHVGRPDARVEVGARRGDVAGDVVPQGLAYALADVEPPPLVRELVPATTSGTRFDSVQA